MDSRDGLWRIEMLGGLRARYGDKTIERFQTQKTGALLARLAFPPIRSHSREELVDLLWPEAEPASGRNRLSQALGWLRSQIESESHFIVADRQSVGINQDRITTDVSEFESAVKTASQGDERGQIKSLRKAIALYQGELLPGYFDDWVLAERSRLLDLFLAAQRRLIQYDEQASDWESALAGARRALAADPSSETAHIDLMRLLASSGQPDAARRQFRELERILADELGEMPSAAACALLDQVRRSEPTVPAPSRLPHSPLPVALTRFFGREAEIAQVQTLIQTQDIRLVTLTGTGGAGKTRLAIEISALLTEAYPKSIWFVPLADLSDARLLPTALADALHVSHAGSAAPLEQVAEALGRRPSLLILDNMEHLQAEAAPLLHDLLAWAPALTVLVTSRHRLGLDGEQEVAVPPLPVPQETSDAEHLMDIESVCLFVDRARAVRPGFAVSASNAGAVIQLCQRLEGLPLALELCAAWAQTLTPAQMLSQLTRRFDLLVSRRTDIAPRHRSLRAAVEYSYLLLPEGLQRFFVRLSAFRGGWTLEAASAICLDDNKPLEALTSLTELRERSLVTADETRSSETEEPQMRYRMLEALREFAAEQQTLAVEVPLRESHSDYFLSLAEVAEERMAGPEQVEWLGRLEAEHDNLRAALTWAYETGNVDTGLRLGSAMAMFWAVRGFVGEGEEWLSRLLAVPKEAGATRAQSSVLAKALDAHAMLARGRAEFDTAEVSAREALTIWQELADDRGVALSLQFLATLAYSHEDYEAARTLLEESLVLVRSLDDPSLEARILNSQGNIAMELRDWAQAEARFTESLQLHRTLGDRLRIASALNNLGLVARYKGDYVTAERLFREDLGICQDLSDRSGCAVALLNRGTIYRLQNRLSEAHASLEEAVILGEEVDNRRALAWCVKELGHLACEECDYARGIRLLSASESMRRALGMSFSPADPDELEEDIARAKLVLSEADYAAAWASGVAPTYAQAYAAASWEPTSIMTRG